MVVKYINYEECTHCLKCWRICPMDVYRVWPDNTVSIAYPKDCMCCYLCDVECPKGAIYIDPRRGQLKTFPW